jgi:hypothetical protein
MPIKQGSGIRKSGKVFGQGLEAAKKIRAGLYARVSTQDQQTLPMQSGAPGDRSSSLGWRIAPCASTLPDVAGPSPCR